MLSPAHRRYLIIGCGVAAIGAAQAIRRLDSSGTLTIVSEDPFGFYSRPGLAFFLTRESPEETLFPLPKDELKQLATDWIIDRVTRIDPAAHRVWMERRGEVTYERLLIATGSVANLPAIPGIDQEGVVKLDSLEDARQILQLSRRARTAVVTGGGITALELVEGLVARKVKVHYFLRGDHYWSNVLDESESQIVEAHLQASGVALYPRTELAAIEGKRGRVASVLTTDGRRMDTDLVGVAIGIHARKELAETAGLQVERGILVDERLQTSQADIYAAGDVAQVYDPLTRKYILDSLWGPARDMGRAAGTNMAGGEAVYVKSLAFNVTRLSGLTTTIIGTVGHGCDADEVHLSHGDSEIWALTPDAIVSQNNFAVNHLRLMVGKSTLVGAVLIGDQTLSEGLQTLVLSQVDISAIRQQLLDCQPDLPRLLANFWSDWRRGLAATDV
jgi:NADPH-dependent 2,4-dienoyl-CoA reductase/sulfur reductase-like enzyme